MEIIVYLFSNVKHLISPDSKMSLSNAEQNELDKKIYNSDILNLAS